MNVFVNVETIKGSKRGVARFFEKGTEKELWQANHKLKKAKIRYCNNLMVLI